MIRALLIFALLWATAAVAQIAPDHAGYPNGANGGPLGNYTGYIHVAGTYTEIDATWRVPSVVYDTSNGTAPLNGDGMFIWPGIWAGGGNLIQAGTAQFFTDANGTLLTRAWYECFSAEAVQYLDTAMFPVRIFDVVKTSLTCATNCTALAAGQTWNIVINNITAGWTFTLNNHSCVTGLSAATLVTESNNTTIVHHSDIPFVNVHYNNANPNLLSTQELYHFASGGTSTATANPSDPNATTDGFRICWGQGDSGQTGTTGYTPCSNDPSLSFANGRGLGF